MENGKKRLLVAGGAYELNFTAALDIAEGKWMYLIPEAVVRAPVPKETISTFTYRRVIHWGLVAGLTYTEMGEMSPGMILDQYIWMRAYHDEQHGIKRE